MDLLNLSKTNTSYIENYINYTGYAKPHDFMGVLVFGNIFAFTTAIYESNYEILPSIFWGILSVGVFVSWIYYLKFAEHTRKNYILFLGIYSCLMSISFTILSYLLLRDLFAEYSITYLLVLIGADLLVACLTVLRHISLIKRDGYKNPRPAFGGYIVAGTAAAATVRILSRNNVALGLVIGVCIGCLGIVFSSCASLFVKYRCYCILEKMSSDTV